MVSKNRQGVPPFGAWLSNYTNSCKIATSPKESEGRKREKEDDIRGEAFFWLARLNG